MEPSSPFEESVAAVEENIQVSVGDLAGRTVTLEVPPSLSVANFKTLVSVRENIPSGETLRLVFAGKQLEDHLLLRDYYVQREPSSSTLHLGLLRGEPSRKPKPKPKSSRRLRCTLKNCTALAAQIVGDCGFCQGRFCGKHRLPEEHECFGLPDCKRQLREANAEKLNSERTAVVRGI